MDSNLIKYALLRYFRFERHCIVGTEVTLKYGVADILAINSDQSVSYEVEVKISIADLQKEFKDKEQKHSRPYETNYFYFGIPENLLNDAKPIIESQNNKFGIMVYYGWNEIKIIKRAKKLNTDCNKTIFIKLVKRISSELITMYEKEGELWI